MAEPRIATVTSSKPRGTWAGAEVQTTEGPVVGVPNSIKKGDRIHIAYRSSPTYGLWFFVKKARPAKTTQVGR